MPTITTKDGHVVSYGRRGTGPPLLLIMGLGAPGSTWEKHMARYEQDFTCIYIDNRGAGGSSDAPADLTTKDMADDAVAVMDALGFQQFCVAGISMGGAIAQHIAADMPERVQRLLIISSWCVCDEAAKRVFAMLADAKAALSPSRFSRLLNLWIYAPEYQNQHTAQLEAEERAADDTPGMSAQNFLGQAHACACHDTREKLSRITAPTLITVGDHDIFTPLHFAKAIQAGIAGSKLQVFEGGAHVHHWEFLEQFNALTAQFLRGEL